MDDAINALILLQSFFPLSGEIEIISLPVNAVEALEETGVWEDDILRLAADDKTTSIQAIITINLKEDERYPLSMRLKIYTEVPSPLIKDPSILQLVQPSYLARDICRSWQSSMDDLPLDGSPVDDILAAVECLRQLGDSWEGQHLEAADTPPDQSSSSVAGPLERVWFWFPSLSTKEKRRDLVEYAKERGITGFVMAGKPGLLCAEGELGITDKYMAAIKSESWSDIPSYQKKVTERYREPIPERAFLDMSEITDNITHNGWRGAKSDMGEVKEYLESKGLGDAFGKVVGSGGFG